MKLLIVSDAWKPQVNGVVRTYEHLEKELVALGHDVKIIGPHDFPWRMPMPTYPEIELALFPYRRLARMIADYAPDSIHIATEGPLGKAARRWCLKNKRRFSTAFHTMFPDYFAKRVAKVHQYLHNPARRYGIKIVRDFHAPAAAVIITTKTIEDELLSWGFTAPLFAMPRGVPVSTFHPHGPKAITGLKEPVALYAGRVAIEKNIEAFLDMPWDGTKIVVGDGPSLDELKKRYPQAIFAGRKIGDDLAAHFRSADVFVFPSRTDTFGIVIVEALACGLPVAGFDVAGPRDIVTHESLGHVHDNLMLAAQKALESTGTAQERHDHVRERYTWPAIATRFLDILKESNC